MLDTFVWLYKDYKLQKCVCWWRFVESLIAFSSVLSTELLLSSVELIREHADAVFERPRDLLVCLICSVAGNMLTAMFLRLALVSSCLCWGQSHFVFIVSYFRLAKSASYFLLSSFFSSLTEIFCTTVT